MKQFFFLQSLPRCGNTLLASLVNENKHIKITANSIVPEILFQIKLLKNSELYKNFPDKKSFDNVFINIFNLYYKDWESKYIIDRGPWGTPFNLNMLKQIFNERKFIIVYRPVLESLASFIKLENPIDIEQRCDSLMHQEGIIGKYLWGIKNIIKEKESYILINYEDLIKNLNKEINNVFNFLNINDYTINIKQIKQLSINNILYDDSIYGSDLHKIRTDKIKYQKIDIGKYLSKKVIKKYSGLDI